MSIFTGKQGYDPIREFRQRTVRELRNPTGEIFKRDTDPPQKERDFVAGALAGCGTVIELGCGLGAWVPVVQSVGADYVGADAIPERITYCRRTWKNVEFHLADCRTFRLPDRTFDAVLIVTVLQHLPFDDAACVLRTAEILLKPGGRAVLIEARIEDITVEEAEARYAQADCSSHMIPKPLKLLQEAVAEFEWERRGWDKFLVTKK